MIKPEVKGKKRKAKTEKQSASIRVFSFLLLAFGFLLAGCAATAGEPKPPEIAYGRDMCDACGMIISEPQFASALLLNDGKTLKFDDAGEMFAYTQNHPELSVRVWFVHDYISRGWINGQTASYVVSSSLQTPMGTGVAAFSDRSSAQAHSDRLNGKVLEFEEARTQQNMMRRKGM